MTSKRAAGLSLAALLIAGCSLDNTWYLEAPLWDASVVPTADGIYVRLPHAGLLVRVQESGTTSVVDLSGAAPERLTATPDGETLLVFARWPVCKDEDPKIKSVSDCSSEDLIYRTELQAVTGDVGQSLGEIAPHMNTLAFSEDGDIAVAYLDYSDGQSVQIDGVADLGEVRFLRLSDGAQGSTSVGFSPERILFSQDGSTAVVMSRSRVVAVDLGTFEKVLEAPLVLDADEQVDPSGAALTPDGNTLLITVQGSSDLYMLELTDGAANWNLASLGAVPSTLAVDATSNRSVFVFAQAAEVDILDNAGLDAFNQDLIDKISLDEPATEIWMSEGSALLYNPSTSNDYHDVYRVDLDTLELVEYVLDNPVSTMAVTDSARYAVATLRPEGSASSGLDGFQDARWGLGVIDLLGDEAVSLVTEARPLGVALVESDSASYALVLLEGLEYLLYVDLARPAAATQIDLPAAPVSIQSMLDDRFLIAHEAELGLLSILDPETLTLTSASGFAVAGLLPDDTLPRRGEEE